MKFRFDMVYRAGLVLLLLTSFWAVWANAQSSEATNQPPAVRVVVPEAASTNQFQALTFGLNDVAFLNSHTRLTQPLWKYLASLIYILLAFCVAWLVDFVVSGWLHRLAVRTETQYDDLLLKLLRGPVKLVDAPSNAPRSSPSPFPARI